MQLSYAWKRLLASVLSLAILFAAMPDAFAAEDTLTFDEATGLSDSARQLQQGYCKNCSLTQSNGTLNYSYGLEFPAGRNGIQPSISINYSQLDTSPDTLLAQGWSVAYGGSISRTKNEGSADMYERNEFSVSVAGQGGKLLPVSLTDGTHGIYGLEVEEGFWEYEFLADNSWRVTDTRGTIYTFGSTAVSRQDDPEDSTRIYRWMLEKVEDMNGNYMTYEYLKDAGQIYPKKIKYTGHDTDAGKYQVNFEPFASGGLVEQSDAVISYRTGFKVVTKYRLGSIQLVINGELGGHARKAYNFSRSQRPNSKMQNLAGIQELYWDGSTWNVLPEVIFEYEEQGSGWEEDIINDWGSSNFSYLWLGGDVNADGFQDFLYQDSSEKGIAINQGEGFISASLADWIFEGFNFNLNEKPRVADINNDGLPDMIEYSSSGSDVFVHNGSNGWVEDSNTSWDIPSEFDYFGFKSVDVNADGLADWIKFNGSIKTVYINNGTTGWAESSAWDIPEAVGVDYVPMDINNDGLVDFINKNTNTYVLLHNGIDGWESADSNNFEIPLGMNRNYSPRIADVNNDDLQDLIRWNGGAAEVYLNNGVNGWVYAGSSNEWDIPQSFEYFGYKQVDINNDGYEDFVNAGTGSHPTYLNSGGSPTLLSKIKNNRGGETRITYQNAKSMQEPDGSWSNPKLLRDMMLVRSIEKFDRGWAQDKSTYSYSGGEYILDNDPYSRTFAGFNAIRATDADGNYTIQYYHQGGGADGSAQGEFEDHFSKRGKLYRSESYDAAGNLYAANIFKYKSAALGADRYSVELDQKVSLLYDGGVGNRATATKFTYDAYGNVISQIDFGEVTVTDAAGEFTDIGLDVLTTDIEYVQNTSNHITSLPKHTETRGLNTNVVAETKIYYDDLAYGAVELGNPTKQEQRYDAANFLNTQTAYDSYGMPTVTTNPRGYATTTTYDVAHLFPATVMNAKNQTMISQYDYLTGTPTLVTDLNGAQTKTILDVFGRVSEVQVSNPETGTLVTQMTQSYDLANIPNSVTKTSHTGSADIVSREYLDGFGRSIQTRGEAEDNQFVITNTTYNKRGQVEKKYYPFYQGGLGFTVIPTNLPSASYVYDALGRITSEINSLGTTTIQYDLWKKYVTDPLGNRRDFIFDARDNLIEVREYFDSQAYSTYYTYDVLNNLIATTDAEGNIQSRTYDLLGRLKIEETLHNPSLQTIPTTLYSYDLNGNLTQKTNPKGQVIEFTYDELDRILTEDYTGATGTEVSYTYDSGTNALGRLTSISYPDGSIAFAYDLLGRVLAESRTLEGQIYGTSYAYNRAGQVTRIAYPDMLAISYVYDAAGKLSEVSQGGQTLIADLDFNPLGAPARIEFGNGAVTTNTYDLDQMYRLTNVSTVQPIHELALQNISYSYDALGDIIQITDASATNAAKTVNYAYDDLYRLTSASATNAANDDNYSRSYTYSITGNMLSRSDLGAYTYAATHPQAVSGIASTAYTYDDDGNLTSDGTFTYTWDYNDRLETSNDGTTTVQYSYDHTGNRTAKTDSATGTQTLYINKYYEIADGEIRHYIYAGNLKIATVKDLPDYPDCSLPLEGTWTPEANCVFSGNTLADANISIHLVSGTRAIPYAGDILILTGTDISASNIVYHHSDHLSGANVDTDSSGEVVELTDYYPYGSTRLDEQSGGYANAYKFTGKELDNETELYYYGARYYDPAIGRFVSIDPQNGDLTNPQTLNKYSYVSNNPLRYTDPTGEYQEDVHYDLTFALGIAAGLSDQQARWIATYDQDVDDHISTNPVFNVFNGRTELYHFSSRESAEFNFDKLIFRDLRDKSLPRIQANEMFGTALHILQDTYSHEGLTPETHVKQGSQPDYTYLNPDKALEMARKTFFLLGEYNAIYNGFEYDIDAETEAWNAIQGVVFDYLKLEDKSGTSIKEIADRSRM